MSLEDQLAAATLQIEALTAKLVASEASLAVEQTERARLEGVVASRNHCWHCYDCFEEEDPPHCGSCPEWEGCSDEGCDAPGCIAHP
jgi:7-cyano-7-deazaguanine synthase in queuosine biosynthesis